MQDAERRLEKFVRRHLEQLVARKIVQDMDQRLAVVAGRIEMGARDAILHLAAQERNIARAAVIGRGGEEADEQALAHDPAIAIEALDAHRIHLHRTMDRGPPVGLGHHQQARLMQEVAHVRGQALRVAQAIEDRNAIVAENAEPAAGDDRGRGLLAGAVKIVVAIAQEGEIVVGEPGEEGARLAHLLARQRRRLLVEFAHHAVNFRPHRPPVLDGHPHVPQYPFEVAANLLQALGSGLLVDAHLHEGFLMRLALVGDMARSVPALLDDGMDHQMDRQIPAVQFCRDRIDEEGHVVVDDLDDRVGGAPAMLIGARVEDADLGDLGQALLAVIPQRERGAIEAVGGFAHEIVGRDVGIEQAHEAFGCLGLFAG